jgi:alkylation response protein AidB-like acyl-CoA dehydrogenase
MDVGLSPEQLSLAEASRQMLARQWTTAGVRAAALPDGPGHSPELWKQLADAGWLRLPFPESAGGDGGSLIELGVVVREVGRALVPTTFASTLHAALLLWELGSVEQQERWLRPILNGELLATVAYAEAAAVHDPAAYQATVRRLAVGWSLSGRKLFVENGSLSKLILVACRVAPDQVPKGLGICAVTPDDEGVSFSRHATFGHDLQDEITFAEVASGAGSLLGGEGADVLRGWRHVTEVVTVLASLEMVGGAQAVIDRTAQYVTGRHAFGKPIGSFQAVQHHLANAAMAVKGADLAAWQAAWRLAEGLSAAREVSIAKASAGRAYKEATVIAHQLHGGMGYIEETDLHLWSRRAIAADLRHGSAAYHMQRLAELVGAL